MSAALERTSTRESADVVAARLAARHYGLLTGDQLQQLGFARSTIARRVSRGRLEKLYPGVYRVAGAPDTWLQAMLAACYAWGQGALLSHVPAGALWDLLGFDPCPAQLIVPRTRDRSLPHVVHRPLRLGEGDRTVLRGIPVTTPARTFLDVAASVPGDRLGEAVDDAIRRRIVTLSRLRLQVQQAPARGSPGVAALRAVLDARDGGLPESVFEFRLAKILASPLLPPAVPQFEVRSAGRLVARIDFAYPAALLAVEAHSYRFHSGHRSWAKDIARENALKVLGWRTYNVTWDQLARPRELVRDLRALLNLPGI